MKKKTQILDNNSQDKISLNHNELIFNFEWVNKKNNKKKLYLAKISNIGIL